MLARGNAFGVLAALGISGKGVVVAAALLSAAGCRHVSSPPSLAPEALVPSPRLIVGRITGIDPAQSFAFVELATDAPPAALAAGTELIARTSELRETGRLRASAHVRGRTLGTRIVAGQPSSGDEVVWLAP